MSLQWFKVDADIADHPKSLDLADALGEPLAFAYMIRLWGWCSKFAADGRIPISRVEHAAKWPGQPGKLVEAAIRVGFLEPDGQSHVVAHGWLERNRAHLEKLERDRRTAEERRNRENRTTVARLSHDRRATIARPSHVEERRGEEIREEKNKETDPSADAAVVPPVVPQLSLEAPELPGPDQDEQVYNLWRELWAPRADPKLDPKRRKLIQTRRKERSQAQLLDSLRGWKNDSWAERPRNAKLEQLLRDAGQIDKGLELLAGGRQRDWSKGHVRAEEMDPSQYTVGITGGK